MYRSDFVGSSVIPDNFTPSQVTAYFGLAVILQQILGYGVDASCSALLLNAVENNDLKIARVLTNAVNTQLEGGEGALVRAVNNQFGEMVTLLLDAGADVNAGAGNPLATAVQGRSTEMVKLLLDSGVDVNAGEGGLLLAAVKN